jgi:hypothetical protein
MELIILYKAHCNFLNTGIFEEFGVLNFKFQFAVTNLFQDCQCNIAALNFAHSCVKADEVLNLK